MTEPASALDADPTLRVGSPADLVELVPYLVGFHPTDSIVFIGLNGPREQIGMTLRLDLSAARDAPESLEACVGHLERSGALTAIVVVYGDPPVYSYTDGAPALPYSDVVEDISDLLSEDDIGLADALLVGGDRWWSYICALPDCCPPEGHVIAPGDAVSPVAAAVTVAGMSAAPDRDALARSLAPLPDEERRALAEATQSLAQQWVSSGIRNAERRRRVASVWSKAVQAQRCGETLIADDDAAVLLAGLRDVQVRDACCSWATGSDAQAARAVVRQLARRATPPWDVAPYVLVAWYAWRDGEGAISRIAVDHAIASDTNCTFARLIEEILDRGVDPRVWRDPPHMGGDDGPRRTRRRGG